jgi:hypothetical protein
MDNGVLVFDGYLKDTNLVRENMWNRFRGRIKKDFIIVWYCRILDR